MASSRPTFYFCFLYVGYLEEALQSNSLAYMLIIRTPYGSTRNICKKMMGIECGGTDL